MAFDIFQSFWRNNDIDKFNAAYEKLFIATTESQDIVSYAVEDRGFGTDDFANPIEGLVDFLIENPDLTEEELQQLRNEFTNTITPTLQSLTEPIQTLKYKDGSRNEDGYIEKTLIVAPIFLSLGDADLKSGSTSERTNTLFLGVVPSNTKVQVDVFKPSDLKFYALIVVSLALSLLLATIFLYQTVHAIIKPLRVLNTRMNEILKADNYNECDFNTGLSQCKEIKNLQDQFSDLISDYKFTQNEFMN